jgi:serine/threonine protein kinase
MVPDIKSWSLLASGSVLPWNPSEYQLVRTLQEAPANQGVVELHRALARGKMGVAVKRMPNSWMCTGPAEFARYNDLSVELPWDDLGYLMYLSSVNFPYMCRLYGIFRDETTTYVVSSLAADGDLFSWIDQSDGLVQHHEDEMKPVITQICSAVRALHDLGIAHRDISLENILLTTVQNRKMVKLIDFGAATAKRTCQAGEIRGKRTYQAPEMHEGSYDPFSSDNFALGVVLLTLTAQEYPWTSTEPGVCKRYTYLQHVGLRPFLTRFLARSCRKQLEASLSQVLSPGLVDTVEGLLCADPDSRLTLGETVWVNEDRACVWTMPWFAEQAMH